MIFRELLKHLDVGENEITIFIIRIHDTLK